MIKTCTELWKNITGFENRYEASTMGRIKSLLAWRGTNERILKPWVTGRGYSMVVLYLNGRPFDKTVHGIVLETFERPPTVGEEPNHKNGDKSDNRLENLEWLTRSQNILHSYHVLNRQRTQEKGESNGNSKLSNADVLQIRNEYAKGKKVRELATNFWLTYQTVRYVVLGTTWKHL